MYYGRKNNSYIALSMAAALISNGRGFGGFCGPPIITGIPVSDSCLGKESNHIIQQYKDAAEEKRRRKELRKLQLLNK